MFKFKPLKMALALAASMFLLAGCGGNSAETTTSENTDAATETAAQQTSEIKLYRGQGQNAVLRVGPGTDANGGQVYTINYVTATALFDEEGRIVDVFFDTLEIYTPNKGPDLPQFSGFPGQEGYLGAPANTEESAKEQVASWLTKRERGDAAYGMNWSEQMDFYQNFFKGMTVAEVEEWFAKCTSDKNGRPLKADSDDPADQEKYNKLTDEEKQILADVTSGATMSLSDDHGDFIGALREAYENRQEVIVPVS